MAQSRKWPFWRMLPVLASLGLGTACRETEEKARATVLESGYRFTIADYLKAAREGRGAVVAAFLSAGMQVDAAGPRGKTALQLAAAGRQRHVVEQLLKSGASAVRADLTGVTPLMAAAAAGDLASVQLLLQAGAPAETRDQAGRNALAAAATAGHAAVVEALAGKTPGPLMNVLHLACAEGHTGVIDELLKAGWNQAEPAPDWAALLEAAARAGHLPAVRLLSSRMPDTAESAEIRQNLAERSRENGHGPIADFLTIQASRAGTDLAQVNGVGRLEMPTITGVASVPATLTSGLPIPPGGEAVPYSNLTMESAESPEASSDTPEATPHPPEQPPLRLSGGRFPRLPCDAMTDIPKLMQMISWEPQVWPVILQDVAQEHGSADVLMAGETPRQITLKVGDEIPGTGCVVEKLRRRRLYTDATETTLKNVSELHFRRVATGEVFKALAGDPVLSNDSTAILRIHGSDRLHSAVPGDEFRLGSLLLRVREIASGAISLENRLTRESTQVQLSRSR